MDYNDFNKTYYRASYEWNVSEYVKTDMDYRNDGKRAGYAFAIPPEEMLNNEAFMAGYEIGYDARENEYLSHQDSSVRGVLVAFSAIAQKPRKLVR